MHSLTTGAWVFACVFGASLVGMTVRAIIPQTHLSGDSKEIVKLGTGLVGTMVALILGLLVASAKSAYDAQKAEITEVSANIVLLDRLLAHYGPHAQEVRAMLPQAAASLRDHIWKGERELGPAVSGGESFVEKVLQLAPENDYQRVLQSQLQSIAASVSRTRMLLFAQMGSSVLPSLLIILVVWLSTVYLGFGLIAPRNLTVIVTFFVCTLSAAAAIVLILELDQPFRGLVRISDEPLRNAIAQLGM